MAASGREEATAGRVFRAKHKYAPITARKARYVVDLVRGLPVNQALERLQYSPRRASPMVQKVLQSAIANAGQDLDVDANRLYISDIRADDGPTLQRGKARSRGQYFGILVRQCHIQVEIREMPEDGLPGRRKRIGGGTRRRPGSGAASEKGKSAAARKSAGGAESQES